VRHIEGNDQLHITRMMLVDEREWREMKSECSREVEQRRGYADYGGWLVVRTSLVSARSLYSIRLVILSK